MENQTSSTKSNNEITIRRHHKKTLGFQTYIYKVLGTIHPGMRISGNILRQVNSLLEILAREISKTARDFVIHKNHRTISSREIQSSIRLIIPGELSKYCVNFGTLKVTKFYESEEETSHDAKANYVTHIKQPTKKERLEYKAGMIFPVTRCKKYIVKETNFRSSVGASLYLAAVLEKIATELLDIAGNITTKCKSKTISTRHVYLAIEDDPEFDKLCSKFNIEFNKSGVVPNTKIVAKGDIALRDIKEYQKTTELLIQKAPFERVVRAIGSEFKEDLRYSEGVIEKLQGFIESSLVHLYQAANDFAIHAKRIRVSNDDILLGLKYCYSNVKLDIIPKLYKSNGVSEDVSSIPDPQLQRLARRAEIKSMKAEVFDLSKKFISGLIFSVLRNAATYTEDARLKTIMPKAIEHSIRSLGYNYIF